MHFFQLVERNKTLERGRILISTFCRAVFTQRSVILCNVHCTCNIHKIETSAVKIPNMYVYIYIIIIREMS
jgi:hypothetical protein